MRPVDFSTPEKAVAFLREAAGQETWALTYGAPAPGFDPERMYRQYKDHAATEEKLFKPASLVDTSRNVAIVDFDEKNPPPPWLDVTDLPAVADYARNRLGEAFRHAACVAVATTGHGRKRGVRLRLFFWLSRPMLTLRLREWLKVLAGPKGADGKRIHLPMLDFAPTLPNGVELCRHSDLRRPEDEPVSERPRRAIAGSAVRDCAVRRRTRQTDRDGRGNP